MAHPKVWWVELVLSLRNYSLNGLDAIYSVRGGALAPPAGSSASTIFLVWSGLSHLLTCISTLESLRFLQGG